MRRETGKRGANSYLNRIRRDDVKDLVKNVLGGIFHWPETLTIGNITAAGSTSVIAETPVSKSHDALSIGNMTLGSSTSVKEYTEISGVTISIASPCVVTSSGHGIGDDERIKFTTTGALPTGLTAFAYYYCNYIDADTFHVTATLNGSNINTTGSQSGVQSVWHET
jgi:hypothetical protein